MKKRVAAFLLLPILALTINFTNVRVAYAMNDLFIYPSAIIDETMQSGSTFGVFVNISDGTAVSGWQIFIWFNRTVDNSYPVLNCTGVWLSTYTSGSPMTRINNEDGWVAAGRSGGEDEVYGDGWLAYLEFVVLDYGSTELVFDEDYTYILDSNLNKMPCTTTDGYFRNAGPGDANSDGIVDIFDIGFISGNWNPDYHPDADINYDGIVDIFDIGITSGNWGNTYP